MTSTEYQINSPACQQARMKQIQNLKQNCLRHLKLEFIGICNLEFEI